MKLKQTMLAVATLGLLSACGGGAVGNTGGGATGGTGGTSALPPSSTLANLCEKPRANSNDRLGTVENEKAYLRSFVDETYLWYKDVPSNLVAANYATAQSYFDALKTPAKTASGKDVDQFHWSQTTESWNAAQSGIQVGYGITWRGQLQTKPYYIVVAEVMPGSPAALTGIKRGDLLTSVDGVSLVNSNDRDAIIEAMFPSKTTPHKLGFNSQAEISFTPGTVNVITVQNVKIIPTANGNIGYFTFDTHIAKSEAELISAINQLKAANVKELILDLRYNGGGLLRVASQLAYMIAGPDTTTGKTFEKIVYNDKLSSKNEAWPFFTATTTTNTALPYLGLKRVSILATGNTASASESIINGLRGVDVTVDLIGSTTTGKPYGFVGQNNCAYTYFAIQFKGENQKGFGDYADGFATTCVASDDLSRLRGDVNEGMLKTALAHRQTGVCPTANSGVMSRIMSVEPEYKLVRSPAEENKYLDGMR